MNIKKIGHCCLLIKTNNVAILTDPGNYSVEQNSITGIDIVLITHEHADHLHIESLKEVLKSNPEAKVITNTSVGKKLDEINVQYTVVEGRSIYDVKNTLIESFDSKHEEIFGDMGQVQNTGYFIDNKLFYPGDSYCNPQKPVDILALPVAGPWCRIKESIDYCLLVTPRVAFPVHDGMIMDGRHTSSHGAPLKILPEHGIEFVIMKEGDEKEF